jgi:hypothetical protein
MTVMLYMQVSVHFIILSHGFPSWLAFVDYFVTGLKANSISFAVGDVERAILSSSTTDNKYIEEEAPAGGTRIRRYKSIPISITLPGQINDANSWRNVQVKVSDLEQGPY